MHLSFIMLGGSLVIINLIVLSRKICSQHSKFLSYKPGLYCLKRIKVVFNSHIAVRACAKSFKLIIEKL